MMWKSIRFVVWVHGLVKCVVAFINFVWLIIFVWLIMIVFVFVFFPLRADDVLDAESAAYVLTLFSHPRELTQAFQILADCIILNISRTRQLHGAAAQLIERMDVSANVEGTEVENMSVADFGMWIDANFNPDATKPRILSTDSVEPEVENSVRPSKGWASQLLTYNPFAPRLSMS
jgi:hypothetical protein